VLNGFPFYALTGAGTLFNEIISYTMD